MPASLRSRGKSAKEVLEHPRSKPNWPSTITAYKYQSFSRALPESHKQQSRRDANLRLAFNVLLEGLERV
jgi:hypothetical protein